MFNKFLHQIALPERAIGGDGVEVYDLPVNPLSVLYLTLRPLNDTGTLSNYARYMSVCRSIERLNIMLNGQSIISMRGEDIAAYNFFRWGMQPWEANPANVNNERRAVVLPIVFGRYPWTPSSCFPASKRGELTMSIQWDIADTGYDGMRFSAESLEFPNAKPKEYEKRVEVSQTFGATGDQDVDLPQGNLCRGILLWGNTAAGGAAPAPTWGRVRVMLDNMEAGYTNTDWEVLHTLPAMWGRMPNLAANHTHTVNAAGAGVEETTGLAEVQSDFENYAFVDFDPTGDDTFALETSGANRFNIRASAETADAVRAIVQERIKV